MACKVCGAKTHWCSNCGCYGLEDTLLSEDICSIDCWKKTEEYETLMGSMRRVVKACIAANVFGNLMDLLQENEEKLCYIAHHAGESIRGS